MEYLPNPGTQDGALAQPQQSSHKILCCQCGVPIDPNPSATCVACLRTQDDLSAEIPKSTIIHFCKFCERYLSPPNTWTVAQLESRELMALCLKRLKNLGKIRLIDANFVWTEPHSKRIKVKLTVQGEVVKGTILQQSFVVEYVVQYQMCDTCRRVEANDTWNANVQVRQKTNQKKTLYYLEQLLMKYNALAACHSIKPVHEGLDFYFSNESGARKLVEFLQQMIPIRYQNAKKLISHDAKSNIFNYKYTTSVDVAPICKDNVVCLPTKLAHSLGGIGQLCVVYKVTHILHLIDPNTCQFAEINANSYFKSPFKSLIRPRQLVEYTIINIEPIPEHERRKFSGQGAISRKHILADAWVVKSSELGMNDDTIHCRTHLGHILHPGDTAMGLDMRNCNANDPNLEKLSEDKLPDIILVKKVFAEKSLRNRKRKWKLKHMNENLHSDLGSQNEDYVDFLEDLEDDADLRQNVNVFKDANRMARADEASEAGDIPTIGLEEMLDEMTIDDVE